MVGQILWAIPISALYMESSQDIPSVRIVVRGLDLLKTGNLEAAERLLEEALNVARQGHHPIGEGMAALCLSNICWGTGRLQQAHRLAQRAREIFRQQPGPDQRHNEAIATLNLGLVRHLSGDTGALNEYYTAQGLLDTARRYWIERNQRERVNQCGQLAKWIQHLIERLITYDHYQRSPTLFLPIVFADGATATLWGEYSRDVNLILEGKTLRVVPLRNWLVLTADCCVFPIPPQVWQQIQPPSGHIGDYVLTHPGDPQPGDLFYIALDSQGTTQFIRQPDGKVVTTVQDVRIIGGRGQKNYRPIALLI